MSHAVLGSSGLAQPRSPITDKIFIPKMEEELAYAPAIESEMTLPEALMKVCRVSRTYCKLFKGARECVKKLQAGDAILVLLAKDSEPRVAELVKVYAMKRKVPIISIDTRAELAKIAGQEKINSNEKTKHKNCCVAIIQDFCEPTPERAFVESILRSGLAV
jgi:small subunit ribosomal protein S12e